MRSNHDPAIVTLFHSTLEHTLDHFLEFWIFEGVRHFLAIFAQPPTTLLTLLFICLLVDLVGTEIAMILQGFGHHPRAISQ